MCIPKEELHKPMTLTKNPEDGVILGAARYYYEERIGRRCTDTQWLRIRRIIVRNIGSEEISNADIDEYLVANMHKNKAGEEIQQKEAINFLTDKYPHGLFGKEFLELIHSSGVYPNPATINRWFGYKFKSHCFYSLEDVIKPYTCFKSYLIKRLYV